MVYLCQLVPDFSSRRKLKEGGSFHPSVALKEENGLLFISMSIFCVCVCEIMSGIKQLR